MALPASFDDGHDRWRHCRFCAHQGAALRSVSRSAEVTKHSERVRTLHIFVFRMKLCLNYCPQMRNLSSDARGANTGPRGRGGAELGSGVAELLLAGSHSFPGWPPSPSLHPFFSFQPSPSSFFLEIWSGNLSARYWTWLRESWLRLKIISY